MTFSCKNFETTKQKRPERTIAKRNAT